MNYRLLPLFLACSAVIANPTVPATNDAAATYTSGWFRLPDSISEKARYSIIVEATGSADTRLDLPNGVTAIQLKSAALPKGVWTWRYALHSDNPPESLTLSDKNAAKLSPNELAASAGQTLLRWKADTSGKIEKYKVIVQVDKPEGSPPKENWTPASNQIVVAAKGATQQDEFAEFSPVAGKHYRWAVQALDRDDVVVAKSAFRELVTTPLWSESLSRAGWSLARSKTLIDGGASQPAFFGYRSAESATAARNAAYAAEFALGWQPRASVGAGFYPDATIEARLAASGTGKAENAYKLYAGAYRPGDTVHVNAYAKYEYEKRGGSRKSLFEIDLTPTFRPFGFFQSIPATGNAGQDPAGNLQPTTAWFSVAPVITFAGEFGRNIVVGDSVETADQLRRLRLDTRLILQSDRIAYLLGIASFSASAANSIWRLSGASLSQARASRLALNFGITPGVGIGVNYAVGREPPKFAFARTVNAGLEVKF